MTTQREHWSDQLAELRVSEDMMSWAKAQPRYEIAWDTCERSDWMMYLLQSLLPRTNGNQKKFVLIACECARWALQNVDPGEDRPRIAIETAEAYVNGKATFEQLREARVGAATVAASSCAAASNAHAYACDAAAYAIATAAGGSYAVYAAMAAAGNDAAAYAPDAVYAANARKEMASIIRSFVDRPELE